jgi:hypothetical protein
MSARSERPKNRRIRIVGGGFRWTRGGGKSGGSLKSMRRGLRRQAKKLTGAARKDMKSQIAALMRSKQARGA